MTSFTPLLVALAFSPVAVGCASSASTPAPAAPAAEQPAEAEEEVQIAEEAPKVTRCHTETKECDLPEPLPPGAGCFCPGEAGAQEAGTAGG